MVVSFFGGVFEHSFEMMVFDNFNGGFIESFFFDVSRVKGGQT